MQLVARGVPFQEGDESLSSGSPCRSEGSVNMSHEEATSLSRTETREGNDRGTENSMGPVTCSLPGGQQFDNFNHNFMEQQESTWEMFEDFNTTFTDEIDALGMDALSTANVNHPSQPFSIDLQESLEHQAQPETEKQPKPLPNGPAEPTLLSLEPTIQPSTELTMNIHDTPTYSVPGPPGLLEHL